MDPHTHHTAQALGDECGVGLEGYFEGCEKGCLGLLGLCLLPAVPESAP